MDNMWEVWLNYSLLDKVIYDAQMSEWEVKEDLIRRGYDENISINLDPSF